MALTRIGGANAITGTIPQGNIANASLGAVTALPAAITTGKVLQFVNQEEQASFTTNSSSAVDSGLNVSITPTATNSKILLTVNCTVRTAGNTYCMFKIYRQINGGGYSELDQLEGGWHYYINETISDSYVGRKVDTTHNTTNQIDYKIYCNVQGGGGNMTINPDTTNALGNFSAMEIGA